MPNLSFIRGCPTMRQGLYLTTLLVGAVLMGGCAEPGTGEVTSGGGDERPTERHPIGKADALGSCQGACGGQALDCWCDELCSTFGDCCADYQAVCHGAPWESRVLPDPSSPPYQPGEHSFTASGRPPNWTIEWNGHEGLDFNAYDAVIRAPYVQDIGPRSATVLWRVSAPLDLNLDDLQATLWVAPATTPVANGTTYTTTTGIDVRWVEHTYVYELGVSFANPSVTNGDSDYWLNRLLDRSIIECRVTLYGLDSDTVYHYRVQSETIDPVVPDGETSVLTLAKDVSFKTAPGPQPSQPVRFFALGDLGPGNDKPSTFYDVFDLFHHAARRYGPQLVITRRYR